jgi:hypothetical protein
MRVQWTFALTHAAPGGGASTTTTRRPRGEEPQLPL